MDERLKLAKEVLYLAVSSELATECELKAFLKKLSEMNGKLTKGYMLDRDKIDVFCYNAKQVCIDLLTDKRPERCFCEYDHNNGLYVLYVYSDCRQYSYHCRTLLRSFYIRRALNNGVKWDRIKDGYKLSDDEYKSKVKKHEQKEVISYTHSLKFIKKLEDYKIKKAKERQRNNERIREQEFFKVLENSKFKNRKCVINKDYDRCVKLYAIKLCMPKYMNWGYRHGLDEID